MIKLRETRIGEVKISSTECKNVNICQSQRSSWQHQRFGRRKRRDCDVQTGRGEGAQNTLSIVSNNFSYTMVSTKPADAASDRVDKTNHESERSSYIYQETSSTTLMSLCTFHSLTGKYRCCKKKTKLKKSSNKTEELKANSVGVTVLQTRTNILDSISYLLHGPRLWIHLRLHSSKELQELCFVFFLQTRVL